MILMFNLRRCINLLALALGVFQLVLVRSLDGEKSLRVIPFYKSSGILGRSIFSRPIFENYNLIVTHLYKKIHGKRGRQAISRTGIETLNSVRFHFHC